MQHAKAVLWAVQTHKRRKVLCRDRHSHLLVEKTGFSLDHTPSLQGEGTGDQGTLLLTGYVRTRPLSVNSLLHMPGLGTFHMLQVSPREAGQWLCCLVWEHVCRSKEQHQSDGGGLRFTILCFHKKCLVANVWGGS